MDNVSALFGSDVFCDSVMRQRLPRDIYDTLQRTIRDGRHLDITVANAVADAMKEWAMEKGATHFTHWFQPMTGVTAEKHDSFVSPDGAGGVIMEFSGKELIQGEPDASSFPSGGLRATFEARGYTAWDATSYAFLKDGVLCIPTAFCSWGGHALDKKTPLLRSMETINRQALRVLRLFGNEDVTRVHPTVGPEQEYFLIDEKVFEKRKDLLFTGRTLFGAKPPKGQELDDHYFGVIKPRVAAFMSELNEALWRLGVYAKTEHNEAAPSQHELASVYESANIAADHNQITMEMMKKIARRHGMVCVLHEKPFAGVNGSGKHNNWSLSTDTGVNLLNPGETPSENAQFLLFLCAVIKAVDEYQDLLRISVAYAGNDQRLGGDEAPPAVMSIFLGEELTDILHAIETDTPFGTREKEILKIGVHTLPRFPKDSTDRNRTSPFAFTGNKFEFRMLGSSASISDTNTMLNTAVAEELRQFADELEGAENFEAALHALCRRVITEHKRIIFNGNGYDEAWHAEAAARGLHSLATTPDCLSHLLDPENVALLTGHKVFSEAELEARREVYADSYCKALNIESLTMLEMAQREILPAVSAFCEELARTAECKAALGVSALYEKDTLTCLCGLLDEAHKTVSELSEVQEYAERIENAPERSVCVRDRLLPAMNELRRIVDRMETVTNVRYWPIPSYSDLLFSVR